jgi:hypothetical protein
MLDETHRLSGRRVALSGGHDTACLDPDTRW